jgi:hypothetical protein
MTLESGRYQPDHTKHVTVWPKPDANGDGEEVWVDRIDQDGNYVGRDLQRDDQGRTIRHYSPPDGFVNRPSFDNTDNYVRVDGRGQVKRSSNGHAVNIKPGQVLVEHADGSPHYYLEDEYSQYVFEQAHTKDSGAAKDEAPKSTPARRTSTAKRGSSK